MTRLPLWQTDWDLAEQEWDLQAKTASTQHPLRGLTNFPKMIGITEETAKRLKWKSLKWMILHDSKREILKGFLRHPLKYGWRFFKSVLKKKSYRREEDFFLYGIKNLSQFEKLLQEPDTLLVLGFSYCHKPFECPSGRFTPDCIRALNHPVCQQCFIGKALHAGDQPEIIPLIIPTVHYIGGKIFEIVHSNPHKRILFMITACEMTLKMFGDWGNMVEICGLGIRLDGRICNTMKAFALSERGVKPGLTVVLDQTQRAILRFIRIRTHL